MGGVPEAREGGRPDISRADFISCLLAIDALTAGNDLKLANELIVSGFPLVGFAPCTIVLSPSGFGTRQTHTMSMP